MLVTASRSLRLYPAASPIPRQSVDAVIAALADVFADGFDSLALAVAREGFVSDGQPVAVGVPGGQELADEFRAHGVSAVQFADSTSTDDILKLLVLLAKPADEIRAEGGFGSQLAADGVLGVSVTEVVLTVMDSATPDGIVGDGTGHGLGFGGGSEAVEIAEDPTKLGAWLSEAASGDRSGLETGLLSLVQAVGPAGAEGLAESMSTAFSQQTPETRDTLLGLAMEAGPFQDLMGEMFRKQQPSEIAGAILGGSFGRNALTLSTALTSLPLDRLDAAVKAQVEAMLPGAGHSQAEVTFLDHMIEVRQRTSPEPSLAASDQTYLAVAQASAIRPDDLEVARRAVGIAGGAIDAAGVRTMFHLLDQQTDPAQAQKSAESLVLMVARLLASKQLPLAEWVLAELAARCDRINVTRLFTPAATPEALGGLIDAVIADPALEPMGENIVNVLGDAAVAPFVQQAIARKAEGLRLAEQLFGKRMMEPLNVAALQAEWFQLAPVVTRLTVEGDSRCAATIEALVRRPDPQARKEIITGLSTAGGPLAQQFLGQLVSDPTPEVAVAAARALAKSGMPGSGAPIAARITQLDLDNADFELGRDLINALARTPDRVADELLQKLASRRSIMKRGRFNDVQAAVAAARQVRSREAVGR